MPQMSPLDRVLRSRELLWLVFSFQGGVYEDMLDFVNVRIAPAPGPDDIFDPRSLADAATLLASWINTRGFPRLLPLIRCLPRMQDVAVWMNRIDLAEFLHQQGVVASSSYPLYHLAAYRGHVAVFEWLRSPPRRRNSSCFGHCSSRRPSGHDAMDHAAQGGHLDVVQFLHEHRTEGCTEYAMDAAAERGHLEVVRWLHEHRDEGCSTDAMTYAARNGHLDVVRWLHEHRTEGCSTRAMDLAATCGHLEIVKFLHAHRHEGCTTSAMDGAAIHGHLDVVQFLHEMRDEGCTGKAMYFALQEGQNHVVDWLAAHRHERGTDSDVAAFEQRQARIHSFIATM
ncbi:unnamed protein product [Aphanomyces euteiches]|uniref:Uncharacterized protein n=1 Tax=Aphanomyces euteiches TaxID=100861 RepID=A0A6G0XN14_9STRA|nr:hypothetical protein Ae201684_003014 [Aphanomyces euteiches]KAH9098747.1 hypothetical protein Ae201684P_017958 [Aphanomyces euteiches]KAH9134933.1 hypothetical protein AeRB84_019438 [Aphanomyces euteiches]